MGKALYRKYRSRSLDEIVGQPHVVSILKRALENNTIGHAYLLTGIRGVGKTSIARIMAHAINRLSYDETLTHLDIIEIDAASNNGVEDIRDLRDKSLIAPVSAPKKIYIIDEVHMLSKPAFNALLKTLEEPPEHVVFILATTDVQKLPATILSRVQRFNLKPISTTDLIGHLKSIAKSEKIAIDEAAIELIAAHGNGSFRDAISLLDQVQNLSNETITRQTIEQSLGLVGQAEIDRIFDLYDRQNGPEIIEAVQTYEDQGTPATILIDQLILSGRARVHDNPQLLTMLDKLVDARKSEWPDVKLLAALVSEQSTVSSPNTKTNTMTATSEATIPAVPKKTVKKEKPHPSESPESEPKVAESKPNPANDQNPPKAIGEEQEFNWPAFTDVVKDKSMGAFSVLSRCGYLFDGAILAIYCGKPFAKKQLEKALPLLSEALHLVSDESTQIELIPSQKPSDNSDIAAAIAIIGGGEEVNL